MRKRQGRAYAAVIPDGNGADVDRIEVLPGGATRRRAPVGAPRGLRGGKPGTQLEVRKALRTPATR